MTYTQTSLATLRSKTGSLLQKLYSEFGLVKTELDALAAAVDTITRSATIVVAASDSSEKSKAQADYVCDGTADNVEIQAAIDALPSTGGKIILLDGTFLLDAPNDYYVNNSRYALNVHGNNIDFCGCKGTTLKLENGIAVNGGAADSFLATVIINGDNIAIHDLKFDNNQANINAYYNVSIWTGDNIANTNSRVDIYNNYFVNTKRWAIWGDGGGSSFWNIHNNYVVPGTGGGIAFHNGPSESIVSNNIIGNDSVAIGFGIFIDSLSNVLIADNIIRRPTVYGIEVYDAVDYCIISNNIIENYYGSAVGILCHSKSTEASACDSNVIQNNSFVNIPTGISLADAYIRNTVIQNNQFVTITTPIINNGTDTKIKNNIGYTTENAGTAIITTGQTSVDVTHGLAATPIRVLLTPTTATAGKQYYVSAKDATTFTITIDSAAEADISFDWQAVI
jgi:hypothetical protein